MDHREAVRTEAVERYLLGQLSGPECEEFEIHFFDCTECARELKDGASFVDNARAVFKEDNARRTVSRAQPAARPSLWELIAGRPWGLAPAMATLALLVVAGGAGYQSLVVIPGLRGELRSARSPQAVASYVLPPVSRGAAQTLEIPGTALFYTIYMDPAWDGAFAAYVCSVQDETGTERFSVRLAAPPPGKPIQILMARQTVPSGRYTVVIRNTAETGKPEAELARYALLLKLN
jgi:hypothetical protein